MASPNFELLMTKPIDNLLKILKTVLFYGIIKKKSPNLANPVFMIRF